MVTPPNQTRGISKLEPHVLLQTKTHDFVKSTSRSEYDYVKTQFLTIDKKNLEQYDLTIDDVFLMDRIYMQGSALPYFLSRGSIRKQMVSKMNTECLDRNYVNAGNEKHLSRKTTLVNMNGFKANDMKINSNTKANPNTISPHSTRKTNENRVFVCPNNMSASNNEVSVQLPSVGLATPTDTKKVPSVSSNGTNTAPLVSERDAKATPTFRKGDSYDVIFGDMMNGVYLVTKESTQSDLEHLQNQLAQETLQAWSEDREEKKLVVVLDGKYFRGCIVKNNLPEIKGPYCIKLVDIGWYIPLNPEQLTNLHLLPDKFKLLKPMAVPIYVLDSVDIPRNSYVTVLATGEMKNKATIVTVKQIHTKPNVSNITNSPDIQVCKGSKPNVSNITNSPDIQVCKGSKPNVSNITNSPDIQVCKGSKPNVSNITNSPDIQVCKGSPHLLVSKPIAHVECKEASVSLQDTLPLNIPVQVIWIQKDKTSENVHWVQDVNYYKTFDEWQASSEAAPTLGKMPLVGDWCLKVSDGEWCRCKVISLDPLTVFYVDFGSEDIATSLEELKYLPNEMALVPPLAYGIKFCYAESNKIEYNFGDPFEITPVRKTGSIYTVLKDKEILPQTNETLEEIVQEKTSRVDGNKNRDVKTSCQDYKYENSVISTHRVTMNKSIEVNFIQDDETDADHKWVQDVQFADELMKWQDIVNNFTEPFVSSSIEPGSFCIKLYEDMWCRAKIVSCSPLRLFYIDFGNIESVDNFNDIKYLPQELSEVKPLAIKVKFYHNHSNVPMEYGKCFFITPIEAKDDVYVVLKDDEQIVEKLMSYYYKDAPISQPSSLEMSKPVLVGFVQDDLDNTSHKWVQDVEFYNYIENWTVICSKHTNTFQQKPHVGEFCVHFYDESWCRAQITQVDPVMVFYIDYGNKELITKVEELKPLPTELSVIKPMAHKVQFLHKNSACLSYNFAETFNITPIQVQDNVVMVLKNDEVVLDDVKSRVYENPVVNLKLNTPVQVTWVQDDEFDSQYTWVQEITHMEQTEMFSKELKESDEKCTQMPRVGDLCGKFYEDVWCRAKVVSTNPLTIFYIDYGNTEQVNCIDELKSLPPNVARYEGFAFRIRFQSKKPNLDFGVPFTFTPISFVDNVYTASF